MRAWATFRVDFGPQGHPRVRVQKKVTKRAHFGTPWITQNHDFALRVLQIRYFHLSRKSPQNGPGNGTKMHQLAPFWAPGGSHEEPTVIERRSRSHSGSDTERDAEKLRSHTQNGLRKGPQNGAEADQNGIPAPKKHEIKWTSYEGPPPSPKVTEKHRKWDRNL